VSAPSRPSDPRAQPGAPATSPPTWWPAGLREAGRKATPEDRERLLSGEAWRAFAEAIGRAGEIVLGPGVPETEIDRAEGYRHLAMLIRMGFSEAFVPRDRERPAFGWADGTGKWGLDCADALYTQASIRGGAVYRVRGQRGSAHFMGFQLMAGMRPAADVDADSLALEPDGSFELVLGGEKREGNWIALPPDASGLQVRQFFYDWDREVPARLAIERIDEGERGEPDLEITPGGVARQLEAVASFVHANADYWAKVAIAKREEHANTFPADHGIGVASSAAMRYQAFGIGCFLLEPDEALIVEVRPPKAKYWSLHLGNFWYASLDFANYRTSINGHQAVLDRDGVFRAVVAHSDPGVPNWLDTAGHREGSMIYRWNQADGNPIPSARVVRLDEVRRELPPETPRVDPAARRAELERRRDHVRRRFSRPF